MNIKKYLTFALAISATVALSGCNNVTSSEVIADHVSAYEYDKMSCDDIRIEMDHLKRSASDAGGVVDKKNSSQKGKNVAAFIFFWPALFMIDDNSAEAKKYARLKGEFETAERTYQKKGC